MRDLPKVLLLSEDEKEACQFQQVLGNGTFLVHARDFPAMKCRLKENCYDVVFCSWSFYRSFWDGTLQELQERCPDLPVVVLSRTGGEREWSEVLEAGAFDLLGFPCRQTTLLSIVEQAVLSYEARKARKLVSA